MKIKLIPKGRPGMPVLVIAEEKSRFKHQVLDSAGIIQVETDHVSLADGFRAMARSLDAYYTAVPTIQFELGS
jgi:hypothetical protein